MLCRTEDTVAHGTESGRCGLVQSQAATCVALGQGLPLSELRFPGLQTKEWCWPLRAIVRFSGKHPAQAGVEKEVSGAGDREYAGLGTVGDRSLFFSGPGCASRSCGPSGKSYITILVAHLQEADSALFYQLPEKAFLK